MICNRARALVCVKLWRFVFVHSLLEFFQDQIWHLLGYFGQEEEIFSARREEKKTIETKKENAEHLSALATSAPKKKVLYF